MEETGEGVIHGDIGQFRVELLLTGTPTPFRQRLVDCLGGPPSKGWIAQMEEHWYSNPEVSGSSPGPVKFFLHIFQILSVFCLFWVLLFSVKRQILFI